MPHLNCVKEILAVFFQLVFSMFIVTFLSFALYRTLPQDSIRAQQLQDGVASVSKMTSSSHSMSLDYLKWIGGIGQGNWGLSIHRGQPVAEIIKPRLYTTLVFSGLSLALSIFSIIFLYTLLYARNQKFFLKSSSGFELLSFFGSSLPLFLIVHLILSVLITYFNVNIHLTGWSTADFANYLLGDSIDFTAIDFLLPISLTALSLSFFLYILMRRSILEESQKDYVRTAYSKGLARTSVLRRHILKNISFPLVAYAPYIVLFMVNGSLVMEIIFNIEGTGLLAFQSFQTRDVPVLMALLLLQSTLFLFARAVSRAALLWLDPRATGEI